MISGLAFHCHHDRLYEFVFDYDERVQYIKEHKPKNERKLRLKFFKLIPEDRMPGRNSSEGKALDKAGEAYDKAWAACDKAWAVCDKTRAARDKAGEAYCKAWKAYYKAWDAYYKAGEAYCKAGEAYDKAFGADMVSLHNELCPDCPWDGKSIFNGED